MVQPLGTPLSLSVGISNLVGADPYPFSGIFIESYVVHCIIVCAYFNVLTPPS